MRSILLVKTSSMGDVIHNLPVVSDLRRHWPKLAIDWVVEEGFSELPALHPGVREVLPVAIRRWRRNLGQRATWREMAAFRRRLQATCYDLVIDTQGLLKSAAITWLADGLRCGYAREVAREPLAALAYHCRYIIPRNAHAVERNRWLAAAAAEYAPDLPLCYGLREDLARPDWAPQGDFVTLLTATSRDDKLWPEADWITLGQALHARGLPALLPAGSAVERARAERIAAKIPGATVAPPVRLSELAGAMQATRGVIGVDTGLTHLAAALERPVIALFVATEPGLTGVYGDARAKNLGGPGAAPQAAEVLALAERLFA